MIVRTSCSDADTIFVAVDSYDNLSHDMQMAVHAKSLAEECGRLQALVTRSVVKMAIVPVLLWVLTTSWIGIVQFLSAEMADYLSMMGKFSIVLIALFCCGDLWALYRLHRSAREAAESVSASGIDLTKVVLCNRRMAK